MNTVKTEHRFSERVLAFFLVMMMFFTSMPESLFSVSAVDDEFQIFLSWNHDLENPSDTTYDSDSPEKKDIRLKISFSNKQVSKEYKPGELMITVSGMKDAVRSGDSYIPVGIAADKESDEDKHYNWSYSYTEATDTYTFTNNFTVESQSVFEGSLEIIWELPSRDTKDNFSKNFIAELFVDEKTVTSEPVTYTQKREKDTYTVEITPSTVYDDELYVPKEERNKYTWVKYNINSGDTYLARDVKDDERFEVWFPENAVVNGGNLESTEETKDIDGKTYKKYTLKKDIQPDTEQPVIKDVIVAYPIENYNPETESVTVYTYLYGTYYEEETESELANDECEIALKDYGFKDPPGDIYHVDKKSYGIHNMTIDQKYADTGAIDARHLTNGGGEYYSDLQISLNMKPHNNADITAEIIPVDYYNIEFVDDFLDIQMKDGTIEQLTDDEYHFTKIRIPPNTEVRNVNGLPIKANTYEVEIWGRVKNSESKNLDAFNVKLSSDDLKITDEEQFIDLEGKNIVGVMIKINEFKESLINFADTPLVRCYYAFSLTDEKAEKVMTDGGKLFNNMFVNLYMKRTDESDVKLISGRTEDYYLGDDAERLKNRDTSIYGKLQDREKDDTPIIEIPNEFYLDSTKIVSKGNDLTNYYFEGSMTGKFTLGEDTLLEKFSMYTIIPKDLRLEEIYNDSETLLNQLQFSSSAGLSSSAIASHVKIEIIDNPLEYDGRQYIALHFDFSDNFIDVGTVSVSGIPMYIAKKDLTGGTHSYTLNGALLVEQDGKWNSETVDNNMMEGGIWKDIDNDGDTGEPASFRSSTASIVYSEETLISLVKYVSTPLTNGPVNPDAETATFDNAPKTYVGGEYSYWLKATVSTTKGGGGAKISFSLM